MSKVDLTIYVSMGAKNYIEIFLAPKMFILEVEVNLNYFKFEYSCTTYFAYFFSLDVTWRTNTASALSL